MAGNSSASQTLDKFCELEELAEEILDDKRQIIELNKKRNTNREALSTVKKHALPGQKPSVKSWVCIGNTFLKLPNSNVQKMLQQDQKNIEEEITKLRNDLKPKVSKLHELEGLPEVKGFDLTALTPKDVQTFR